MSILERAQGLEWPQFFVDIRHDASHQEPCGNLMKTDDSWLTIHMSAELAFLAGLATCSTRGGVAPWTKVGQMSHEFQNPNNQYDSTWFHDQCCTPNTLDFLLADDWLKPIFDFLHTHSARLDSSQWWNPGEYQGSLNFEAESNPKFLLAVFLSVSRLLVERFWRPQLHQIEERGAWEVVTTINLFFFFLRKLSLPCLGSCWIVATIYLWHLVGT